jgi:hypothetical protein
MGKLKGVKQEDVSDRIADVVIGRPIRRELLIASLEREMKINDYIVAVLQQHKKVTVPKNYKVVIQEGT